MRPWALALLLLAGCASPDPGATSTTSASATVADPWEGASTVSVLHIDDSGAIQADVLCQTGGGVAMPREGGGLVLPGSDHLQVRVEAGPSASGVQLGYAIDRSPAYDERGQDNITWLPIVRNGAQEFSVPVQGRFEATEDDLIWAFYLRMNTEATDCYTGAQVQGTLLVDVQAVKGNAGA